ncbi:hypothetical protein [Denitromonas sp.]|uniref:hypothetical protein n=1 Tax=Denitromonas sp. TaxID=2734609 RepID=UPI002AFF2FEA|nr:hypothetical protein [Denitromonas sp.]
MSAADLRPDALPGYERQPELALVAALQLVTRYSSTRNPRLAEAVVGQLRAIAGDPRIPAVVQQCASRILGDWQMLALGGMAHRHTH